MENDLNKPVTLKQIVEITHATFTGDGSTVVTDVTHDSRNAGTGSLFVAVRGELFDAHNFVPQVMEQGAVGVISEQPRPDNFKGAWLKVQNVLRAMAVASVEVHHHPSREMHLVLI